MVVVEHVHSPQYWVQDSEQIPMDERNSHNQDDGNPGLCLENNQQVAWQTQTPFLFQDAKGNLRKLTQM